MINPKSSWDGRMETPKLRETSCSHGTVWKKAHRICWFIIFPNAMAIWRCPPDMLFRQAISLTSWLKPHGFSASNPWFLVNPLGFGTQFLVCPFAQSWNHQFWIFFGWSSWGWFVVVPDHHPFKCNIHIYPRIIPICNYHNHPHNHPRIIHILAIQGGFLKCWIRKSPWDSNTKSNGPNFIISGGLGVPPL